jgi:D-arabinose 1-dehydrogenase-like Zn-dependent alcohol dehydrogenase
MRAVGLFAEGGPEVLQIVQLPEVHAGPGQVRIRVHAATVNPTDVGVRNGTRAEQQKADPPPYVPGMDVAGIIDEVGSDVPDRLKVGDAVMAIVVPKGSHGGYREQIVLDARSVVRVPAGKSHIEASTLPMNGLTARLSLDLLKLSPGQVIAVTGAAGAYGGYVIQLAKTEGLTVIADGSEKPTSSFAGAMMSRRGFGSISLGASMASRTERCSMRLSCPPFAMAAPSPPFVALRGSRSGTSTSRRPGCAPMHRSGRSSIGCANWSRSAKSRFAWRMSIRRNGRPTPIVG